MSITDELRAWAKGSTLSSWTAEHLTAIADHIDAEHEAKVAYWQEASYRDGYDEGFASADDWLAQHEDAMAEHGWIRLPKDADGEVIHVGDVLTDDAEFRSEGEVVRLMLEGEDWFVGFDSAGWAELSIHEWHHHHAPTVEDVLREFANEVYADADNEIRDRDFLCAKYAKRLTLAEESSSLGTFEEDQ